jgi:hypothetical protein
MIIRISFPIQNKHQASISQLNEALEGWVEEQSILTIESASIWVSNPLVVDIIPWALECSNNPDYAYKLQENFQLYLDKNTKQIPPQKDSDYSIPVPWYQTDERFSIDYI